MPKKPETKSEDMPLFKKLDAIVASIDALKGAIEEKDQGITHQLCRIADAIEGEKERKITVLVPRIVKSKPEEAAKESPIQKDDKTPEYPPEAQSDGTTPITETSKQAPSVSMTVETVRMLFTEELEEMLDFEDKGDWIRVSPRQYLGSDNFAKVLTIVRSAGGEYKSDGRNSHFKVPK